MNRQDIDNHREKDSQALEPMLSVYAIAASAAGVSLLALVQPAYAEVVFVPTYVNLHQRVHYALDIDGDGITDFTFIDQTANCSTCRYGPYMTMLVNPTHIMNGAVLTEPDFAMVLPEGVTIGPDSPFPPDQEKLFLWVNFGGGAGGPWAPGTRAYLGLKFTTKGELHYGWAQISIPRANYAVLRGYAYETNPNTPIVTEPPAGFTQLQLDKALSGSLGALARGSRAEAVTAPDHK
ncbi:MAG: hypothetical protein H0X25_14850 [Acidobacteriales bacterium]|nr:hypothetical protein [Terriglobales bacterium]